MRIFTCEQAPADHLGVAQQGTAVLFVVRESAHPTEPAELTLSRGDARRTAVALRALINGTAENGADIGPVAVRRSISPGKVLISATLRPDAVRHVVITDDSAAELSSVLFALASDAEMIALGDNLTTRPPLADPEVTTMSTRVLALILAFHALGEQPADVLAAARWIVGAEGATDGMD